MTKADWLDFLKPLMVVQQLKKKLQQHLQQVSFKMTHQQLKRHLFKKHQHNQSLQGLKPTPVQGVPNQAVRPQAGFANGQAGQQVALLTVNLFNQVKISNLSMAKL